MEVLSLPIISLNLLEYMSYPDIVRLCRVSPVFSKYCQDNDAYWQRRITREFGIPSRSADTFKTYGLIYRFTRRPAEISFDDLDPIVKTRDRRLLEYFMKVAFPYYPEGEMMFTLFNLADIAGFLGYSDLVDRLIEHSSGNIPYAIKGAARANNRELMIRLLNRHGYLMNAIEGAAQGNHQVLVDELISMALVWHSNERSHLEKALDGAAYGGHLELLDRIIARLKVVSPNDLDQVLNAAVQNAIVAGNREIVARLFDQGATNIKQALRSAVMSNNPTLLTELLQLGSRFPDKFDKALNNALVFAVGFNRPNMIRILTDYGTNSYLKALERAYKSGRDRIVIMLIDQLIKSLRSGRVIPNQVNLNAILEFIKYRYGDELVTAIQNQLKQ